MRLVSDNSRAAQILGWRPAYQIEEGLSLTIEWLKDKKAFGKPNQYNY
jgi:nucleoside-diphosphate-sugar epimerase